MKRGEVTMYEFEDERPIPLGRAAAVDRPADEAAVHPVEVDEAPAASVPLAAAEPDPAERLVEVEDAPASVPPAPATHIEKTRAETTPSDKPPTPAPPTVATAEPLITPPAATMPSAAPVPPAAEHPLGALVGFASTSSSWSRRCRCATSPASSSRTSRWRRSCSG
jgi:hypothetical protein